MLQSERLCASGYVVQPMQAPAQSVHHELGHLQEADVAILGVILLWRTLPRLRVQPPRAAAYEVAGTANCITAAHAALVVDSADAERYGWMLPRKDTQELQQAIERCGVQHSFFGYDGIEVLRRGRLGLC